MTTFKRATLWLAKPVLLHWLLPCLMALVAAGTVAQKYIGLFESQNLFFSSFFFWAGFIPLPGMRSIIALLLISLLAKLIAASPWHKLTSGIFIAHLGVAMLLLGGLLTAASSVEGFMALGVGESASQFNDYHKRELAISKNGKEVMHIPLEDIAKGQTLRDTNLPFSVTINDICRNCTMALRSGTGNFKGPAQKVKLSLLDNYLEDERNLSGIEMTVTGADTQANGTYIAFEPMDKQPSFSMGQDTYRIALGRKSYTLPFTLQLLDAHKELHPGTDTPRSYRSTVMLSDGDIHQRAELTMNYPLRYKGYTVYQSSFNGDGEETKSVSFAVVRNSGRVFPYIASITLCVGLLIHLALRLPGLLRRNDHAA